jgi:hypothetical protein
MRRTLWWVCIFLGMALLTSVIGGCDEKAQKDKKQKNESAKVEYFRATQGPTMTTHGKIKMDTVEDKDGKIQYQTEDGKRWRVDMTLEVDKTYRYGTPEEVP